MNKIPKYLVFAIVLPVLCAAVLASNNHLTLLAVSEQENNTFHGEIADLYLEIRDGKGNVYIDTYPLSKFDTQLSIRFAKDTACKFSKIDCSKYDFLYTIRAKSKIIGGPSAGAAIAVLTYAQLNNLDINESISITGTIGSGRLIGNVGSIKEKIKGAARIGISKVLIPKGEEMQKNGNMTESMSDFGKEYNITVVAVSDLEDALYQFTGKDFKQQKEELAVDMNYLSIMKNISDSLCSRADEMLSMISGTSFDASKSDANASYQKAIDLLKNAKLAYNNGSYYASSSQCYGANVELYFVYMLAMNYSESYYDERMDLLQTAITAFNDNITGYASIPALQTAMIVKQRLEEAQNYLDIARNLSMNKSMARDMVYNLALAIERLYTVKMWSYFFSLPGDLYLVDDDVLRATCYDLIDDAENQIQYAQLYVPDSFMDKIIKLNNLKSIKDSAFCIAKASMIRADVNAYLSTLGLTMEDVKGVSLRKLEKASEILREETSNNRFPILGYSYYEYGKELLDRDAISSLIYSEYALELSNLDIYLNSPKLIRQTPAEVNISHAKTAYLLVMMLVIGYVFGLISSTLFSKMKHTLKVGKNKSLHHHKKKLYK